MLGFIEQITTQGLVALYAGFFACAIGGLLLAIRNVWHWTPEDWARARRQADEDDPDNLDSFI